MGSTPEIPARLGQRAWLITAFCVSCAAAGLTLLYRDMYATGGGGHGTPIAILERREAKVRRKPASSYVWQNVEASDTLYRKESIQTGAASAAVIRLNNGTELELNENSLIVLDDVSDLALSFVQGSAVIHDAAGARRVSTGIDGKAKIERIPVQLLVPGSYSEFFVPEAATKAVSFSWSLAKGRSAPNGYGIQISENKAFRPERTIFKETASPSFSQALAPGRYFWRVISKEGPLSETRQFLISVARPLRPSWPVEGKVSVFGEEPSVQFRWVPSEGQEGKHAIQVSRDPEFRDIIQRRQIEAGAGSATLGHLPAGALFWRILSTYGELSATSPAMRFTLEKTERIHLALSFPKDGENISNPASLRFSWNCDRPDLDYHWELQSASGAPVSSGKSVGCGALWARPQAGAYRWRVVAGWNNRSVGESEWRSLLIASGEPLVLISPRKNESILFWEPPKDAAFRWRKDSLLSTVPGARQELQVARDSGFSKIVARQSTDAAEFSFSRAQITADPSSSGGTQYFWRVRILNRDGTPIKTSDASGFVYGFRPVLPAPKLESKTARQGTRPVFNLRDEKASSVLSWTEVKDAKAYEVTLTPATRGPASITRHTVSGTSYQLGDLPAGLYQWSVRAIDSLGRPGMASSASGAPGTAGEFEVTHGIPLKAPRVISPEVQ